MERRLFFSKRFFLILICTVILTLFLLLLIRFYVGKNKAEKYWQHQLNSYSKIKNIGSTKSLEILPLSEWFLSDEKFKKEAGVSYLVKTDTKTILFDVGLNRENEDPSPLMHNMDQLDVSIDDIDTIFISHNHVDHVGGIKWTASKTFSLTNHQIEISGKEVYTPLPMKYPGLRPELTEQPKKLAEGVATTGVIANQLFFLGFEPEQALVINVEGKGLVLIIGCGHQTVSKLLQRIKQVFDEPIYGIVGGLHYAVTDSRGTVAGIGIQKYVGTGRLPWKPITMDYVHKDIELISKQKPKLIRLSGHDSCDASLESYRNAFPLIFQTIKVGEKITI
mgnify:CR=1 FL=1